MDCERAGLDGAAGPAVGPQRHNSHGRQIESSGSSRDAYSVLDAVFGSRCRDGDTSSGGEESTSGCGANAAGSDRGADGAAAVHLAEARSAAALGRLLQHVRMNLSIRDLGAG